ncbi:class I SAM-dependent methyltransferase [Kitasatospora sp. RB6PN24]|uniref:class I SAM-dependent methyltransferase n=1 Tax=Kitasatospora humi TaxID=2893891 RepID=UPI001E5CE4D3|nr:class I SAM-dependent methyltransferase [Kitasatospora humi]MCC9306044.1 class I SAM-dependent methyltransferase [Kitasatospora humi]
MTAAPRPSNQDQPVHRPDKAGTPVIDDAFMAAVNELSVPEMGTDATAPLLYWLIRTVRPQHVLEVGMGYTTPFLAQALRDNATAVDLERSRLGDPAAAELQPLAHAEYYEQPYRPRLVCIDRMTDPTSSAPRALKVLDDLGLTGVCTVVEGDMTGAGERVQQELGLIDFAWIDTWDTLAFVREYWQLINPAGGMLAVHYLMTYPQGRAILHYLKSLAGPEGGLEITNLREPHRTGQNSTTLIRRIRDYVDPEDLRPQGTANDPTGVLDRFAGGGR